MNPQVSPWMVVADRQRLMSLQREQEEKALKEQIRIQYQKELADQIEAHNRAKLRKQEEEKKWEKQLVDKSIESQQKVIQKERYRSMAANERQNRLDIENEQYKAARRQRQEFIEETNRRMENHLHWQAGQRQRQEQEQLERKKKQLRQSLKETIDYKNNYEKFLKDREKDFQNHKLQEHEMLLERDERNRQEYLQRLKQKAATIDYGSHDSFQKNYEKTLLQRKKEEWEREKESLERIKQSQQYELEKNRLKHSLENNYRDELKRQMENQNRERRHSSQMEVQKDHQAIRRQQEWAEEAEAERRRKQGNGKKDLLHYLQSQVEEKQSHRKDPYFMKDREYMMNMDVLRGSKVLIPGQTYELDHSRKRQLELLAKSLGGAGGTGREEEEKYLAGRGRNILG